jgi:hypothetical protein
MTFKVTDSASTYDTNNVQGTDKANNRISLQCHKKMNGTVKFSMRKT